MTIHPSWVDRYRVVTAWPTQIDICLLLFVDGVRVAAYPTANYEDALKRAERFAKQHERQVKLLPVTADELLGFVSMTPEQVGAGMSADTYASDRALIVQTCMEALQSSDGTFDRKRVVDLLTHMGVIRQ